MSEKQGTPIIPPLNGGGGNNGGSNGGAPQQTVSLQQVLATAQSLDMLTSSGQQFVISSVPGLTQVLPSGATTSASLQQLGVTRIVNISNSSPRVSVVAMPGASNSTIVSPSRQTPTKVVLTTSPKLVRTSIGNMFVTPSSGAATVVAPSQSPPARKRLKLSDESDVSGYRRWIIDHKMKRMRTAREKYAEAAAELFFLCAGGNMMDYNTWKKRPPTSEYLHFLRQHRLDPEDDDEDLTVPLPSLEPPKTSAPTLTTPTTSCLATSQTSTMTLTTQSTEISAAVPVTSSLPATVAQITQQGGTSIVLEPSKSIVSSMPATPVTEKPTNSAVLSGQQPIVKLIKLPPTSIASTPCDTQYSKEQIVEKAKQEAYVMQRIAELQREGLWSERRLPKLQEPTRTKAHWDYLLEEMVWLAADFAQERKWKKAAAKKCARMVQKHFQEKAIQAQKAEKLQELRLKKIASFIAKEIKTFWTNVEKLVEYKQQTRLEEKRKKVLDQHLNFIVGQTERYSTWLTEGLNKTEGNQSVPASINSSRISSPVTTGKVCSDDEFEPNQSSEDDEETIAKAEEEMKSTNHVEEVELLKKESELPLEDLLKELPPNYLEQRDKSLSPAAVSKSEDEEEDDENQNDEEEDEEDTSKNEDGEFKVESEDSTDDEDTIMEQEKKEKNVDHRQEIDELNAENEMSIDELMAKYSNLGDVPMNVDESEESENEEKEEDESDQDSLGSSAEEDEDKPEHESSQTQSEDETGVGLKSLLEDFSSEKMGDNSMNDSQARKEMDDVAALAESIQPKGNTLLTTSVVTKIPFLLKHCLREYQHIGLDWLVTMYERKLNGILADEMGLGKTIQTIALLAHLACEQENWGPHLIIVPTSVMLNWEMEFKKWCPGFKILTYYGTQKERKQKRTGWTKPNAFHICITSYKLVIQDHQSFRRKKWKYLILDEAQNIKNFKSQRWQLLLNFQTQRRLLLTGTPLQNNLMELWSLMHFLMPNVFQSHREFREWFSNPVTGMIEGNSEYNENIIRRLHKVLRPFLLRRLKIEVEKQLPKKYEHVLMCRLSKRQRFLYDDFMSRAKTKETLASGNLLSVINVLMQLRKVCNHPNLFEVRPTVSPFQMEGIDFVTASQVWSALDYDLFKHVSLSYLNLNLLALEGNLTAYMAHRIKRCQTPRKLIEEIDSQPEPPPRCPPGKIKIDVRLSNEPKPTVSQQAPTKMKSYTGALPSTRVGTSPLVKSNQSTSTQGVTLRVADGQQLQGYSVQLVPHQGSVKAIPVSTISQNPRTSTVTTTTLSPQRIAVTNANVKDNLHRIAQTVTVKQSDSVQRIASFAQLVQTSTGKHLILTSTQQSTNAISLPVMTSSGQRLTMLPKSLMGLASTTTTSSISTTPSSSPQSSTMSISAVAGKPLMRVPPLNISASSVQLSSSQVNRIVNKAQKDEDNLKEQPKSHFYSPQLEEDRKQRRQAKLKNLADINDQRCAACPLYGEDLFLALRIGKPATSCPWHNGSLQVSAAKEPCRTRRQFFSRTEALAEAIKSTEKIVEELKEVFQRFVVCVPAVQAPSPRFHVSHPPPHKLWAHQRLEIKLQKKLAPKFAIFHPITSQMMTQFPDPRLIQYDCGKLQSLNLLLRRLKTGNHRVLIFTQMTRMLDVLEAFLNYHGHIYLRLDGATKVDQRQILMERFNGDARIFCFILSTRSGGVGVNLTGADTVIFYDSDWNPTMDAQAQDRCHRIGQTRDVHIYRLVSEKTIEENILKKANQKRLLGDLAIEGGNFTTAYFKNSTIQDLFTIDNSENDASTRMAEILEQNKDREKCLQKDGQPPEDKLAMGVLENALAAAEEDLDVQAAKTAKAEAVAELAEFDENIPIEDAEKEDTQISKAEQEVQNLVSQLTPVERYAMKFVEECDGNFSAAQLAAAERELEEQKKEWEMNRMKALREEEERRMRMADDDEEPLTYGREDAQNQVNNPNSSKRSLASKKVQASRRSARNRSANNLRHSSRVSNFNSRSSSDSESGEENDADDSTTTIDSETETQSEVGVDSPEDDSNNESQGDDFDSSIKIHGNHKVKEKDDQNNGFDLNSPRTRSRGNVKINLWTLDDSPIMPVTKYKPRGWALKRAQMKATEDGDSSFGNETDTTIKSNLENGLDSLKKTLKKSDSTLSTDSTSTLFSMSPTVYLTRSTHLNKSERSDKDLKNHDSSSTSSATERDDDSTKSASTKPKNPVGRPRKRPLDDSKKTDKSMKVVEKSDKPERLAKEEKLEKVVIKIEKIEKVDNRVKTEKGSEERRLSLRSKPFGIDGVINKRVEVLLENCDNFKEIASPRERSPASAEEDDSKQQAIVTRSSRISVETLSDTKQHNGDDRGNVFAKPKELQKGIGTLDAKPTKSPFRKRPDTPMPKTPTIAVKLRKRPDTPMPLSEKTRLTRSKVIEENLNEPEKPQRTAKVVAILGLDSQTQEKRTSVESEAKPVFVEVTDAESVVRKVTRKRKSQTSASEPADSKKPLLKDEADKDDDNNEHDENARVQEEAVT